MGFEALWVSRNSWTKLPLSKLMLIRGRRVRVRGFRTAGMELSIVSGWALVVFGPLGVYLSVESPAFGWCWCRNSGGVTT